jgi:hypothetical protein
MAPLMAGNGMVLIERRFDRGWRVPVPIDVAGSTAIVPS